MPNIVRCTYCGGAEFENDLTTAGKDVMCANRMCRHWFRYTPMKPLEDLHQIGTHRTPAPVTHDPAPTGAHGATGGDLFPGMGCTAAPLKYGFVCCEHDEECERAGKPCPSHPLYEPGDEVFGSPALWHPLGGLGAILADNWWRLTEVTLLVSSAAASWWSLWLHFHP